ncbi:hypothetical protein JOL79_32985 [Microbispora sp. RL4-1S]|uniref:Helix-turn-helix domain-containing protein n=1 Tax=Microbispora oryzae TaxID=2806554 RepID=A0A941AMM2_9ACTN|nr:hypothetical protein [Microbispora oryzae]MBP2708597.1 hypothetical protein [Microbispora oryzae]
MRVLDPAAGPVEQFACELRALRAAAGEPPFWKMARRCEVSKSTLAAAVAGYQIPSEKVARNFVLACGGDWAQWRERWSRAIAEVAALAEEPDDSHRSGELVPVQIRLPARRPAEHSAATNSLVPVTADHSAQDGGGGRRRHGGHRLLGAGILLSGAAAVVLLFSLFAPGADRVTGPAASSASGREPEGGEIGGIRGAAPGALPRDWTATSGPACATGDAVALNTSGSWRPLPGGSTGNCGAALIHKTTDSGDGANWVFHPGAGKTCTFGIHIPNSNVITARNATYQAWDTLPGEHFDEHRIGANVSVNQRANRGGTITIEFGPTKNGTIDLQLYDNYPDRAVEAAGTVTATCR